jgi:hypothetical protein
VGILKGNFVEFSMEIWIFYGKNLVEEIREIFRKKRENFNLKFLQLFQKFS